MRRWTLVFAQHFCIGLVTRTILDGDWLVVVVVAYAQHLIWWQNIGTRIDLHGSRWAAHAYAGVGAAGVAAGAWFWSRV
jgi:hypothetical protein